MGNGRRVTTTWDPCSTGDELQRVTTRVVGVIGDQQFVVDLEAQRSQDRIGPGGCVRYRDEPLRIRTQERGQRLSRRVVPIEQPAREELHGLALELVAKLLLEFEHRSRAGAERSVVQEHDIRIELPVFCEKGGHGTNPDPLYYTQKEGAAHAAPSTLAADESEARRTNLPASNGVQVVGAAATVPYLLFSSCCTKSRASPSFSFKRSASAKAACACARSFEKNRA